MLIVATVPSDKSSNEVSPVVEVLPNSLFISLNLICPDAVVFNFSNPMQRICHAVTTKFPDLRFIGLCHEIKSMNRQLPDLMETEMHNIEYRAAGLNHLSILLEARYKNTGKDGYPIIKQNFDAYFSDLVNKHDAKPSKPGAERGVFRKLFKTYGYLPITTDSHLGEYIISCQEENGSIAWEPSSKIDPWDHVESAMGLDILGLEDHSKKAYEWLINSQESDGSWFSEYKGEKVINFRKETNFTAYIATGAWHHYLNFENKKFLEMHPAPVVRERNINIVTEKLPKLFLNFSSVWIKRFSIVC